MKFTLGADPEIFFKKNGKPISAYGLIPGDKKTPHKTPRGAIQVDGTAGEFNIDPVDIVDFEGFNLNIVSTMKDLKAAANEAGKGISLSIIPVQEYDKEYLDSLPDEAKELGCDPDYNAYTLEENPRPDGERTFRTGAGHVHIGWGSDIPVDNPDHMDICAGFVKVLDATVGMFMTIIDRDPRRRELYGKAGAMRMKPYGVEYRTPSNLWLTNRNRRFIMHGLINRAVYAHRNGHSIEQLTGWYSASNVRDIIDTGDVDRAYTALLYAADNTLGFKHLVGLIKNEDPTSEKKGIEHG